MPGGLLLLLFLASCVAAGREQDSSWKQGGSLRPHLSCDTCVLSFAAAEAYAESKNATQVVAALERACHKLFNHSASILKVCLSGATAAGSALAQLPEYAGQNYYPPPVACAMLLGACKLPCCNTTHTPEQMYVTFGRTASEMRVTWVTLVDSASLVQWGPAPNSLTQTTQGFSDTYTAGGWVGVVHHAYLANVEPGAPVYYRVGDGANFSSVLSFVNPVRSYPQSLASVGDMGTGPRGVPTMAHLEKLISTGQIGWVLHAGDVAYADGNQEIWDSYGREIGFASRVPYVLLPGNHEIFYNFSAIRHRFPMSFAPGALGDNLFWAFDMGRVRFVGLNSESILDTPQITPVQQSWVEAELRASSARKRSGELDWIVVTLHRPLYCSPYGGAECGKYAAYLRTHLEELFVKSLVDLVLQAHRHNYGMIRE
jgi:hypothetical protein